MDEQLAETAGDIGSARRSRPAAAPGEAAAPFIDREHELAELRAALDAALAGRGGVVLLAGEPGIGKTRLAAVLAAEAASRGVPVWWGRGWEDGSAPAFWPWSSGLRRWQDHVGPAAAAAAAGAFRDELAHVFPALGEPAAGVAPGACPDSDGARFRLFGIVSRFLADFARPAGLVVVLDDVHWADGPSLKLLEFVAAEVHDAPVLVVATYRDTEVHPRDPFSGTLARLAREPSTRRLLLGGLAPEHCARWIASAGLTGADADVTALSEALHRETDGNPFFVGEIVRLLASEGDLEPGWDLRRLPQGLRDVIGRRLSRLGDACREVLAVAALLGDLVDGPTLAETLAAPATSDHLERAVRDRILVRVANRRGRYRFAHALIRRVLAEELPPSARAAWHARVAAVLERDAAACDLVTTELVRHFVAADTPESLRKAFDHACRGAEQAARDLGWEEAVRLYEIALDVGARCGALDAERTIELELSLARALRGAGDIAAARARCAAVRAACRRTPRPVALARAALIQVGPTPEFGRTDPGDRAILEEACRGAGALDDGLRARLYARLAGDLIAGNETAQGVRVLALCDEAARAARRAGDDGALAMALLGMRYAAALRLGGWADRGGKTGSDPAGADEGAAATDGARGARRPPGAREIIAAAESGGEHDIAAALRHLRAVARFATGDRDAFCTEVDDLAIAAAASQAPQALWLADCLAALRATAEGRFAEARSLMDRALATGRRTRLANAAGQHVAQRVVWHLVQGRVGDVADEVDAFVERDAGGLGWRPMRALARLARGEVAAARGELEALLAEGMRPAESGVMSRCYLAAVALLCVELGDREHAPALYARVACESEAWIVDGCQTLGPWALVLGALALLCGRPADATRHLEQAITLARRMRARPFIAQAQALLAEAMLALHPRDGAQGILAALDEAAQSARELGLLQVLARVERLRAGIGAGRAAPAPSFRRDGEVWAVSFAGSEVLLKDGKGPAYLAMLLAAPHRELHVLELACGGSAPPAATLPSAEGLSIGAAAGPLDDAPDARARREYRARLEELRAEMEDAEERGQAARAERLRAELEQLVSQLAQRFAGRARTRSSAETARKAVTKVLRIQIAKLLEMHPRLGEHLRASLRMGTFCSYEPPTPTAWEVTMGSPSCPRDAAAETTPGAACAG